MEMKTEQDIDLETLFEERSEDPCEHPNHDKDTLIHGGPGEWLLLRDHKGCSKAPGHILVCGRFFRVLFSGTVYVYCMHCGEQGIDVNETYTIVGRKGVDF